MNFTWVKNEIASLQATLTDSNITINKAACGHFENVRYVLLGYNLDTSSIAIKAVSPKEYEQNIYPINQLHKLYLGKSYGRVSNKSFMTEIANSFHLNYGEKGIKCNAEYRHMDKMLVIKLERSDS